MSRFDDRKRGRSGLVPVLPLISALVACALLPCLWPLPARAAEPGVAEPDPVLGLLLEEANFFRVEDGLVPLGADPRLDEAAQEVADRITVAGSIALARPSANAVSRSLEAKRYQALRLVLAYAESHSDPETLVQEWIGSAPEIFDELRAPDLRHLGLGVGDVRGTPVYVLVAAVSAVRLLGDQARDLDDLGDVRERALEWVNDQRRKAGLHAYHGNAELDRVAQAHAEDMLRRGYYSHDSPEGKNVLDRVRRSDYPATRVGENIASGQPTLDRVLEGWLASPDHRANLLHAEFRQVGLGVAHGPTEEGAYEIRWVQVFGSRR